MVAEESNTMSRQQRGCFWHSVAFAVALCISPYLAASAKDFRSVQDIAQSPKDEDPKAAVITLKNAIRKSPQDAAIHVKLAKIYFQIGDAASAEREARA